MGRTTSTGSLYDGTCNATHGRLVSGGTTRAGSRRASTSQISKVKEMESRRAKISRMSNSTDAITAATESPVRKVWIDA